MRDKNLFFISPHILPTLLPDRLKEAREAIELTMEELGCRVGITRQAVSLYEAGERIPEPPIMMRLIQELNQPISFFTSERPITFGKRSTIFFRSYEPKIKRTNKKLEILSSWFVQIAAYFNNFINLPTVNLPEVQPPQHGSRYTFCEIERIATECRRFWGLGDGPISDLVTLCENKGIVVARIKFETNIIDAFSFWDGSRPFIFLGSDKNAACRSRFDVAHELGHIILHRGVSDIEIENDLELIEKEANHFASSFLLPEKSYSAEVFSLRINTFLELKKRWKVSIAAQIYRCHALNLISQVKFKNLMRQISIKKWREIEPLDLELSIEKPRTMRKCLKLLVDNNIKNPNEFLSEIKLNADSIRKLLFLDSAANDSSDNPNDSFSFGI